MSKKFKRSLSIVLAILMIAAMSCIAATSAGALTAGTQIFLITPRPSGSMCTFTAGSTAFRAIL